MKMKNKKAGLTAPLIDFWSLVAFILIAIVVFFVIKLQVERNELTIRDNAHISDSKKILQNFLRTEIEVDGRTMQISELIVFVDNEPINGAYDYLKRLTVEKNKIFESFLQNSKYNCVDISAVGDDPIIISNIIRDESFTGSCFSSVKKSVITMLPAKDHRIKVELAIE